MPTLVAHRGHPHRFPENTVASLKSALEFSAEFVEFDLQLSADGRPFLFHDDDLARCTGTPGLACDRVWSELAALSCGEPERFGDAFAGETIPSLDRAVEFLSSNPSLQAFVELKPQVLRRHRAESFVCTVLDGLAPILDRCVIISFSVEILKAAREHTPIGWILEQWSDAAHNMAQSFTPGFLFVDRRKLPPSAHLWPGPWDWAVYSVDEAQIALEMAERGFEYIETNRIGELRGDPRLEGWT